MVAYVSNYRKFLGNICFMLFLFTLLPSLAIAGLGVRKSIPKQWASSADAFDMVLNTYTIFEDVDTKDIKITVTQEDGSALPDWLSQEAKTITLNKIKALSINASPDSSVVKVVGNYLYAIYGTNIFAIFALTNPASPKLLGTFEAADAISNFDIVGNTAYLAIKTGLEIVNIANKSSLRKLGSWALPTSEVDGSRAVTVIGSYAYLSAFAGLHILDIRNSAHPVLEGTWADITGWGISATAIIGDRAYLATVDGIKIVDITSRSKPKLVGTFEAANEFLRIEIVGKYLIMKSLSDGFFIAEQKGSNALTLVSRYADMGEPFVRGDLAYTPGMYAFNVLDIANPARIKTVATYTGADVDQDYNYVAIFGNYAYLASQDMGFGGNYPLNIFEGISPGIHLSGNPSVDDVKLLNLKVTANDGSKTLSTLFSINVTTPYIPPPPPPPHHNTKHNNEQTSLPSWEWWAIGGGATAVVFVVVAIPVIGVGTIATTVACTVIIMKKAQKQTQYVKIND